MNRGGPGRCAVPGFLRRKQRKCAGFVHRQTSGDRAKARQIQGDL
jgi:hypothetical protein